MSLSTSEGFSGLACRNKDGNWQIRAHMAVRPVHGTSSKTVPASGAGSTMIDKIVDQLIDGDVLGSEEESVVITSKWRGTH